MQIKYSNDLEFAREPGTSRFSVQQVAQIYDVQQQDLAAITGTHRNTLRTHPESARLQAGLRDLMRLYAAAHAVQPDAARAVFLVKNVPIPAFGHKTLIELMQAGRTEDAINYLESISGGFAG